MKHKFILGLAIALALTSIVIGVTTIMTAHDGSNNLSGLGAPAALGGVLLILVYTRLRAADQDQQ